MSSLQMPPFQTATGLLWQEGFFRERLTACTEKEDIRAQVASEVSHDYATPLQAYIQQLVNTPDNFAGGIIRHSVIVEYTDIRYNLIKSSFWYNGRDEPRTMAMPGF